MTASQSIRLYESATSSNCQRVKIVLEEKGLNYQTVPIDLKKGEQKKPEFLKLNPYGKVPVIADGETVLYESIIINEYLDEKYPKPRLMPADPAGRGKIRISIDYGFRYINPFHWALREQLRKPESERDPAALAKGKKTMQDLLFRLEQEIANRPFLGGDAFTLLDAGLVTRFLQWEQFGLLSAPSLDRLSAWLKRMKERPSVRAIL